MPSSRRAEASGLVRIGLRPLAAVGLLALCVAGCTGGAAAPPDGSPRRSAALVEMSPAEAAQAALKPLEPGPPDYVDLGLDFPNDGTIFSVDPEAYVAGRIDAPFGTPGRVDAIVVVDASESTQRSAAVAPNPVRDRVRGRSPSDGDPSILEAELRSARLLLEDVDPRKTRLGLVVFSAADRFEPPRPWLASWTEATLTRHLDALADALERVERHGAAGGTDMAAGLDRAVDELLGRGRSRPDPDAQKVVVFFTDGTPTGPFRASADNERAVIRAAERAAAHGVRVFSFAVGPEALRRPLAAVEMARRTGGVFTPVRRARDLTVAVQAVRLSGLEAFEIRNVTLDRNARRLHVGRDGRFDALVPLAPGRNRLSVRTVVGGVTAVAERDVHYAPGSARTFVPPTLEERRLRLAQRGERQLDVAAGDPARVLESIARDRITLEERAARQLKELDIDVASPPPELAVE